MRVPRTLRARLALSALIVATAWVVLLTAVFNLLLVRRLDAQAYDVLRTRAAAAAATVSANADGTLVISDLPSDTALDSGIWVFEGKTAVERPAGAPAVETLAAQLAGTDGKVLRADEPAPVELLSLAVRHNGTQVGTVVAVISLEAYKKSTRNTVAASVLLGVLLLVFVYVLTQLVIRRALAPVAEMTRQAGEWSNEGTARRFGEGDRPGELADLAETLDDLLDRLSAVLRREEQLSAEISHELRTPLAGIVAETELFVTRQRTATEAVAAMESVAASARRMEGILATLLASARAEKAPELGRSDACAVIRTAVAALGDTRVRVTVAGDDVVVGVDAPLLERVLGPLLDNAIRFARSEVQVRVSSTPQHVLVEVLDDGPGVPVRSAEEVFEPGRRLATHDAHEGAGLGLALARRLARFAGGELACDATSAGGRFVITLPHG
ncbi:MAG: sensor histidine kinase [Frankiales bacterium]|nr:sensor histidine kinase [Frankiales bacterium]